MDVQNWPRRVIATAGIAAGATAALFVPGTSTLPLLLARRGRILFDNAYVGGTASFKVGLTGANSYQPAYSTGNTQATIPAATKNRAYVVPPGVLVGDYSLKVIAATKQTTTAGRSVVTIAATD